MRSFLILTAIVCAFAFDPTEDNSCGSDNNNNNDNNIMHSCCDRISFPHLPESRWDEWIAWKNEYHRVYDKTEEYARYGIWNDNYERIMTHNSDPTQTFTMGLNDFSDLTMTE